MHKQASVQSEEAQDTKLPSQQAQAGRRVRRNSGYHRACYTRNLPFTIHVISEPRAEPPRRPRASSFIACFNIDIMFDHVLRRLQLYIFLLRSYMIDTSISPVLRHCEDVALGNHDRDG